MSRPTVPIDRIQLYIHYTLDPSIPELIRVRKPYGRSKRNVDEPVGFSLAPNNYAYVSVLGKKYRRSRIIYSLCKGPIPEGYVVDHIDGNRSNDHPDNLRVCTWQENRWNADGHSGKRQNYLPKGVSYYAKEGRYRAMLRIDGRHYTKLSYDIKELVVFLQELRQKHHKSFAYDGWTEWTEKDQKAADRRYGVVKPEGYKSRVLKAKREETRGILKGHNRKAKTDSIIIKVPTYDTEGRLLYRCAVSGRYYARDRENINKRIYWKP